MPGMSLVLALLYITGSVGRHWMKTSYVSVTNHKGEAAGWFCEFVALVPIVRNKSKIESRSIPNERNANEAMVSLSRETTLWVQTFQL